ncbi:Unknown protein, partial [Striga hermonthica]
IAELEARRSAQKRLVSTEQDLTEVPLKRAMTASRARTESNPAEPESPLTFDILQEQLPEKIKIPQIGFYDGTSEPDTHLGLYTSWIDLHGAPDALRCRMFSLTLEEKAQRWYHSLAPHSIAKWSQLKSMFRTHFIGSQACRIPKESITHIIQGADESLKNYITRFNERVQNMEPCHQETLLVLAYSGLRPNSMFKWTLCQNKPQTYHEFLMKAQQHIMAKENMSVPSFPALNEQIAKEKESRPNKEFVKDGRSSQFRAMQRKHHEELTNSYQGVYSAGAAVVYEELKNKGIIPDPRPIRADEENLDKSRYCAYHKVHGHNTDQCRNLTSALLKLIDDPQVRRFTRMDAGNRRPRNDERMNPGDEPDFGLNPRRANEHHNEILTI